MALWWRRRQRDLSSTSRESTRRAATFRKDATLSNQLESPGRRVSGDNWFANNVVRVRRDERDRPPRIGHMCFSRIRSSGSSSVSSSTSPSKSSRSMGRSCPSGYRFAHNEKGRKLASSWTLARREKSAREATRRGKTERRRRTACYRVAVRRLTDSRLTVRRRRRRRRSSRSQPWRAPANRQAPGSGSTCRLVSLSLFLSDIFSNERAFPPRSLCRYRGRVFYYALCIYLYLFSK